MSTACSPRGSGRIGWYVVARRHCLSALLDHTVRGFVVISGSMIV